VGSALKITQPDDREHLMFISKAVIYFDPSEIVMDACHRSYSEHSFKRVIAMRTQSGAKSKTMGETLQGAIVEK
jgi:hypothetical protein